MDQPALKIRMVTGLNDVSQADWDRLANPSGERFDPFLSWAFLEALEASGSAVSDVGWTPVHLLAEGPDERLLGAMPLYVKTNSQGEFVFDHSWADAYMRAGGNYYPKLLCAVPFTPVTGRRLLVPAGPDEDRIRNGLLMGAIQIAQQNDFSSLHLNFVSTEDARFLDDQGLLIRHDQQFHWTNQDYACFDDFLAALSSSKRKNLRKERARAQDGLDFVHLTGSDIKEEHWDAFWRFYIDTGSRKWGSPYLTREAFSLLGERMADHILLVFALAQGQPIAGAMNLIGSDTLYGRYWGCTEQRPMLHFETCYYQAIDFAIEKGLKTVEAGAQGGHKLARGYAPVITTSAHWIAHPGLRSAIDDYLERERRAVEMDAEYLSSRTPFRKSE